MFELTKDPTESLLHSKSHFCDSKLQQQFILKEEISFSKNEIESLLGSLGEFLKAFDQTSKVWQIALPEPKFEIGFAKANDELFSLCYKNKLSIQTDEVDYRSGLK